MIWKWVMVPVCLSPLLPQIFVHIVWVFLTRRILFNTWHDFFKNVFLNIQPASQHYCQELRQKWRPREWSNRRVEGPASKQTFMRAHLWVCVFVLVFVCVWKIGWQHICHCSRTLLLLSGTADGCLSNASVRMPIHQLKQMLNADMSCICLTLVIQDALPQAFS